MKKIYSGLAIISMVLLSNSAFSQQKISADQIQPVLDKLETLGKQNPSGAIPLDKLSKEEFALYRTYKSQQTATNKNLKTYPYGITEQDLKVKVSQTEVQPILNKIKNLGDSPLAFPEHLFTQQELKTLRIYELQNLKTPKGSSPASGEKLLNKAYALNGRNAARPFGTMPLVPPHTLTPTGAIPLPRAIYADDIAGNGKLYALDNASRNLVTVNNMGTVTDIGAVNPIPAASTLSGLSWDATKSKMFAIAIGATGGELYSINLTTGAATLVGAITGMTTPIWLEIDNAGNAFSADITSDKLYSINLANGAATEIGALGVNMQFAQDADFNKDTNVLYAASYTGGGVGGIYTINTTTGAATLVGDTTPDNAEYTMFSVANTTEPVLDKAFTKNSNPNVPVVFGTMPLTPPNTLTTINPLSTQIFADDLAGDGNLYGLDYGGLKLVKIFSDGTSQPVGALTNLVAGDGVTGLSWNRANNKMYATSLNATAATLYTVDLATGTLTVVGTIAGSLAPIWLEIDNAGLAYIADVLTDKLYSLNLTTAVATEVGNLGINIQYAQDADFNTSNNVLYMAAFLSDQTSNLYTVNTATGAATLVGDTAANELTTFTIADTIPNAPLVPPLTCGDTFLDSGGAAGNYSNNEDIVYHFAPTTAGQGVKITFTQVEIEKSSGTGTVGGCWDYLSFYNGPTINSAVLAAVKCGETSGPPSVPASSLLVGDSFTSTDPSGQLTVRFRSDSSLPKAGWSATITCASLAVDNVNGSKFSYYPNPTTGILNITASGKIENVEVYNLVGQKVMSFSPKTDKSEINMSSLAKGVYLVKALVNGKVVTNKVIKQ
ncbi:T9SS type A sorting domain-containing protein [Kaistella sp. G5-32]|uniref:T9SS type A sorting domain-containing protein n=1 Tax=Kaistella gelatinilytica TaxID=2787636 RepID=A0ABS0FA19_9FLAO|nr:T9SS type A sorting domain-containing protein [Kaistella gelatinilytica]MBF8456564.1 T9SS type A sorting domain-containing protein [Kaistella gelatinilytica]